ncbi:adhesin [Streptomyces sp. NPDC051840]|uniref:adhesin n=1 Tax=Streptomyces sp. NPDC051840 TaxID=3154752 RepID=UPI00341DFA04
MRCQHCGGEHAGPLPGMACPGCGSVDRSPRGGALRTAGGTPAGRISGLFSRRGALVSAGAVLAVGGLATAVFLASAGPGDTRPEAGRGTGALPVPAGGGAPTRIGAGEPGPSAVPATGAGGFRFAQWAGPGCGTGTYTEHGRFENGDAGWYTVEPGGFDGASCDGRFSAVPMSGSPGRDRGSSAVWSWHLGDGFGECALTVFVPSSVRDRDVAGDPTVYRVLSDPHNPDSAYTGFAVRQPEHRGSAVDAGTYPVKGDTFAVQLVDRGRDWGDTALVGAHHAAAQLKASCR